MKTKALTNSFRAQSQVKSIIDSILRIRSSAPLSDWTVGCATLGSPHPGPLPRGEGECSTTSRSHPCRSLPKQPSAKHPPDAYCSLSLRERVRVRGNTRLNTQSVAYRRDSSVNQRW